MENYKMDIIIKLFNKLDNAKNNKDLNNKINKVVKKDEVDNGCEKR